MHKIQKDMFVHILNSNDSMSIYKPNNFYPYMQEVDLESMDGTVFSCQVNTDGNSTINAARLRILDKDKNIVLYEKIKNLDSPVKNGELVEFKVEPYKIPNENWKDYQTAFLNFVTLTPDVDISLRKDYCPYNLYQSQIYDKNYFNTYIINETENLNISIDNYNVKQTTELEKDLNVTIETKYDLSDSNYSSYIVLKNNREYVWEIELFEHEISRNNYDGTYIYSGQITGSVGTYFLIDKQLQDKQSIKDYENNEELDLFIDVEFDSNNSNLFEEEIKKGYVSSGNLLKSNNENNANNENNNYIYNKGNLYFVSDGTTYNQKIRKNSNYNSTITGNYTAANGYYIFGDFYEINEYGERKLKQDFLQTPYYSFNNDYFSDLEYPAYLNPTFSPTYSEDSSGFGYNTYGIDNKWRYVENVNVRKIDDSNNIITKDISIEENKIYKLSLIITDDTYVNETESGICHRVVRYGKSRSVVSDVQNNDDECLFACRNAETQVICTDVAVGEGRGGHKKVAVNDDTRSINAYDNELVYVINDICYRIRVLNPRPISWDYYHLNSKGCMDSCNIKDGNSYTYYYFMFYLNNKIDFDFTNWNPVCDKSDVECFGSNIYFNAVEDLFNKRANSFFCESAEKHSPRSYSPIYFSIMFNTTSIDNDFRIELKNSLFNNYFYPSIIQGYSYILKWNQNAKISLSGIKIIDNNLPYDTNITLDGIIDGNIVVNLKINDDFKNPILRIDRDALPTFLKMWETSSYNNPVKIEKEELTKIDVTWEALEQSDSLYLDEYNVDILPILNDIKVDFYLNDEILYKNISIKNFINNNKRIELYDKTIMDDLITKLNDTNITYNLKVNQRELISWKDYVNILNYRFLKLESENPFDYILKDGEKIKIYNVSNKTTKNSFFGEKSLDYNIDYLYIRFPNYDGKDYAGNSITKCSYEYLITNPETKEYYEDYKVPGERFEKVEEPIEIYYKLFKVTSYDYLTGEFVIAGGLSRKILETDAYEIWKAIAIEGSSNDYDITEVSYVYERLYPDPDPKKGSEIKTIGDVNPIIFDGFSILNTCEKYFFIQPNSLVFNNEYNMLYIDSKYEDKKYFLEKNFEKKFYDVIDHSIIKIDNSLWMIPLQNTFSIYDDYDIYQDTTISGTNYFYSRDTEKLDLYIIPTENYEQNILANIPDEFYINTDSDKDYITVKDFDFYIYGNYIHKEPLKRYDIKIYDSNMSLIYHSDKIYNSQILYRVKGLNNNTMYYMTIECENQLGNVIIYEQLFLTQYEEEISNDIKIKVENDCKQSSLVISFVDENNNYCNTNKFIELDINEDSIIKIYRKNQYGNISWIHDINLKEDALYYDEEGNCDYRYMFMDYNVYNNEKYEYLAVLKITETIENEEKTKKYLYATGEGITQFDSWTIVDIVENDDTYSVVGDVWSFRYNLESENLNQNTSTTTWDTLGKYGQVGKGEKDYITSGLTCLLGDVGYYNIYNNDKVIKKYGYHEKDNINNAVNNIMKYKKWKKFCNSFTKKLLKDIKGNKWIVQIIETPSVSNADNSQEQIYKISFSWQEIADSDTISIVNNFQSDTSVLFDYYGSDDVVVSSYDLFDFEIVETIDDKVYTLSETSTKEVSNSKKVAKVLNYKGNESEVVIPYKYKGYPVTEIMNNAFSGNLYIASEPYCENANVYKLENGFKASTKVTEVDQNEENYRNYVHVQILDTTEAKWGSTYTISCLLESSNIDINSYMRVGYFKKIKEDNGSISSVWQDFEYKGVPARKTIGENNKIQSITFTLPNTKPTDFYDNSNDKFNNIRLFFNIQRTRLTGDYETITVTDIMLNRGVETKPYCENKKIEKIIMPNSITTTESGAFAYCRSLKTINIPNSVTNMNNYSFEFCTSLEDVTIPDSMTSIGYYMFYDCKSLQSITIPDNITAIGDFAFAYCNKLKNISGMNNVERIGNFAFSDCRSLININTPDDMSEIGVNIPESVSEIGSGAFYHCSALQNIIIPNNVTVINNYTFVECSSLKNIKLSDNLTTIGDKAFMGCKSLTNISIPESVTTISDYAFAYGGLTKIEITNGVTSIGSYVFYDCSSLTSVTIRETVTSIGKGAFEKCISLTSIKNFDSVTTINGRAFYGCKNLITITIPDSVTSIGARAFEGCTKLTSVITPDIKAWCNIDFEDTFANPLCNGGYLYINEYLVTELEIPDDVEKIKKYVFYNCDSLQSITIPNSVTSIDDYAFYDCSYLTNIKEGNNVTDIGNYAFSRCIALREIVISNGVTIINEGVFSSCNELQTITIPESVIEIKDNAFYECGKLSDVYYLGLETEWNKIKIAANNGCLTDANIHKTILVSDGLIYMVDENDEVIITGVKDTTLSGEILLPSEIAGYYVTSIGNNAFNGCNNLIGVEIPDRVTSIGDYAFEGCTLLKTITIPNSVTSIGKGAFSGCTSLTSIVIPNGVTKINGKTFYNCTALENITFSTDDTNNGITSIGAEAFEGCTKLYGIKIPSSVVSIDYNAFRDCKNLKYLTIYHGLTSIGQYAFAGCDNLTDVEITDIKTWCNIDFKDFSANPLCNVGKLYLNKHLVTELKIPDGVEKINNYAFYNCKLLDNITIPDSVTSIGDYAFSNCKLLDNITIPDSVTSIGDYVFYNCELLDNITIPDSVTSIGDYVFYNCELLQSVTIPDSVTSIGERAFSYCTSLTSVKIPDGVMSIGASAFNGCGLLGDITIPDSVTSIGSQAFYNCDILTKVKITDIKTWCNIDFKDFSANPLCYGAYLCNKEDIVFEIVFPDDIKKINNYVFYNCKLLDTITIPDSVTEIGNGAFYNCSSLETIYYIGTEADWDLITIDSGNEVLTKDKIVYIIPEDKIKYTTANGEVTITGANDATFSGNIILPSEIDGHPVTGIGFGSFFRTSITDIKIPDSVKSISQNAFKECKKLVNINLPNSLTSIGSDAFVSCSSLTNITFPNSLQTIGKEAFQGCHKLNPLEIPNSVTSIGNQAFQSCYGFGTTEKPGIITIWNPYVELGTKLFTFINDRIIIKCYEGSTAETYAKENGITREYI